MSDRNANQDGERRVALPPRHDADRRDRRSRAPRIIAHLVLGLRDTPLDLREELAELERFSDEVRGAQPLGVLVDVLRALRRISDAAGLAMRRYCSTNDHPSMIGMRRSQMITAGWMLHQIERSGTVRYGRDGVALVRQCLAQDLAHSIVSDPWRSARSRLMDARARTDRRRSDVLLQRSIVHGPHGASRTGTTSTGQDAFRMTASATLPKTARSRPLRP